MRIIARDSSGIEGQSHDAGRIKQVVFRTGYRTVTDVVYRRNQRWKEWTLESDEHGVLILRRGVNSRRGA